jgi:DNA-binding MarR family transcriptional regulator
MPLAAPSLRASPASPEERLARTVARLTRSWMRLSREGARGLGLSLPQLLLLGGLYEIGEIPERRWVQMIGVSPSATSGLLDGLEAEGYIQRTHDKVDRRQVLVSLSPKGRKLTERVRGQFRRRWKAYCADIPAREMDAATATLDRLVARMIPAEAGPECLPPEARKRRRST